MAKALSLKLDDMSSGGGGILADTKARLNKVRFGMETYRGKAAPAPALMIEYTDLEQEQDFQQSWTVGSASDYTPSEDGKQLMGKKPIRLSSNFGIFMKYLSDAIGADELAEHVTDDSSAIEGMEVHFIQIPDERPTAEPRKDPKTGKEYPATIPVIDQVMVKPWDKAAGAATETAPSNEDLQKVAVEIIKGILKDNPNGMDRNALAGVAFQKADKSVKTDLVQLIATNDAFVSGIDGVTFENNVLKLS